MGSRRVSQMQKNRQSILTEEWAKYLENAYPHWWEQEFKNIWFFNIIYYSPNYDSNTMSSIIYRFHSNRFSTMKQIRYEFNAFLSQQHSVLKLCFGNDIYEIIKNYLPPIPNLSDNYIYVHKYLPDNVDGREGLSFMRFKTDDTLTLNHLMGKLPFQNHDIINLRIRSKKFNKNSSDLIKKFYLKDILSNPIN